MAQDTPRTSSQHIGDLFVPEGQGAGIRNRGRRKRMKRKRKGTRERGERSKRGGLGIFVPERQRLPLNREET